MGGKVYFGFKSLCKRTTETSFKVKKTEKIFSPTAELKEQENQILMRVIY